MESETLARGAMVKSIREAAQAIVPAP